MLQVRVMNQEPHEIEKQKLEIKANKYKTDEEMVDGFDVDKAVQMFDKYTREKGDLLKSKLVSLVPKIFHFSIIVSITIRSHKQA